MIESSNMLHLTWQEFAQKKNKVLVLCIGAIEQHGPHLPIGTDYYIATGIASKLAESADIVIGAPFTYGYKSKPLSGGGPLFPGTIDLSGSTLIALCVDVLNEYIADGFLKIFILNAHFENEAFLTEAMDIVTRVHSNAKIVMSNWWDVLCDEDIDYLFCDVPFPSWALEHAALTETSLMLYLKPELVRVKNIKPSEAAKTKCYSVYPVRADFVPKSGVLAPAVGASAAKGEYIVKKSVKAFLSIMREEFGG